MATTATMTAAAMTDDDQAEPVVRSAWLSPCFYLSFVFAVPLLLAVGCILLWRMTRTIQLLKRDRRRPSRARWQGQRAAPST